jgi:transposase
MYLHANAKLGLAGRVALVRAIEDGLSLRAAAGAFKVSPAAAHRWWQRWLDGGRESGALLDRSSRPRCSPRLLAAELQRICACRRESGWGPRLVAAATGIAHSTVWKVLHRHGLSRRSPTIKEPANSYEWPCPGDLLHMDTSRYARFLRPGHRVTGDRSQCSRDWMKPQTRVGFDYAHAIVDDHSRLAYVELHDDERAATVTGFVERALVFFDEHGITTKRLMTDNAFTYVHNRSLRELLAGRRDPPPQDRAVPAAHERESGALPPDDGARVGLRAQLPLTSTPQPGAATLAEPLQHAKATQLDRRPATHQPRSQRPWVGHLAIARFGGPRRATYPVG